MKKLILVGLLALAACSKPAPPPEEPVASAEAPPPVVDAWPGKYEGDVMVRVFGTPGAHRVALITAAPGCDGDIGLMGGEPVQDVASGLKLTMKADAGTCTIDIHRQGNTLIVSETGACLTFHGGTCSFNGQAAKVK